MTEKLEEILLQLTLPDNEVIKQVTPDITFVVTQITNRVKPNGFLLS